jgi:hypothetical protein
MEVRPEDGQLQHAPVSADRGVGRIRLVGGDGREHRDAQVEREQHDRGARRAAPKPRLWL